MLREHKGLLTGKSRKYASRRLENPTQKVCSEILSIYCTVWYQVNLKNRVGEPKTNSLSCAEKTKRYVDTEITYKDHYTKEIWRFLSGIPISMKLPEIIMSYKRDFVSEEFFERRKINKASFCNGALFCILFLCNIFTKSNNKELFFFQKKQLAVIDTFRDPSSLLNVSRILWITPHN